MVTGANSGIGPATTRELVRAGARVVMAVRDTATGAAAAATFRGLPGTAEVRTLDLADLVSVHGFAAGVDGPVDVLVDNAGLMAGPQRRTADGFEMQIGTDVLGHFALTGLLLPRLTDRVVTLSSLVHRMGGLDVADLNRERRRYQRRLACGQSKPADLMFASELQRRLVAAGARPRRSRVAHPGCSATNLQSRSESVQDQIMGLFNRVIAQGPEAGALPTLHAATEPDLPGGSYIGPDGLGEIAGAPRPGGVQRGLARPGSWPARCGSAPSS